MKTSLVTVGLTALLLMGCGKPIYGEVKAKPFAAAHSEQRQAKSCSSAVIPTESTEHDQGCTLFDYDAWVPAQYYLTVCREDVGCLDKSVDIYTYEKYAVGSYYDEREMSK